MSMDEKKPGNSFLESGAGESGAGESGAGEDDAFEDGALEAVAVIGLAGRFPGARTVGELWRHVETGVESITFFDREELLANGVAREVLDHPDYVAAGGVIDEPDHFDAELFGLTPREAEVMDPQHRLFLECAWQAAEDAGYDLSREERRVGVYGGTGLSTYLLNNLATRPDVVAKVGNLQVRISNDKDSIATWVSYKLDLHGPSMAVQSACSTSLLAIHLACQAIFEGECDIALAGGVALGFPMRQGYLFQEGGILSPDGRCRAFDAAAAGTVPGNGAGVVVLKRLADAIEDGDAIRAVVRATAANNDGSRRAGFTAPGVEGQMRVVAEAQALAEISPETVGYVECHGSGTAIGDPIELQALSDAFRRGTEAKGFCALGSVKTNVGHLDTAAGVTGFIKAVSALEAKRIPPVPHFETPNPAIDLAASPFYVPTEPTDWPAPADGPRRAGVSSFGIGGTNVHVVLEEAPEPPPSVPSRPWQVLLLSARSAAASDAAGERLAEHLATPAGAEKPLADVAHTLATGRRVFRHRRAVVARDTADAVAALSGKSAGESAGRIVQGHAPAGGDLGVAFLFPGLGDHHPGMGRELYDHEPVFRHTVDESAEILRPHLGLDLRQVLYPEGSGGAGTKAPGGAAKPDLRRLLGRDAEPESVAEKRLNETWLAQPVTFVVELALARLLWSWGVRPKALIGYSLGEYVAATVAGVFSRADALALVAERAKRIAELPVGAMLAVPLAEDDVRRRFELHESGAELSISAANGASLTVVAGPEYAVGAFAGFLEGDGVACRRLRTTHAFHSTMMEPLREALRTRVLACERSAPKIPFLSNVTGTWITAEEATDPGYWADHLVRPVRFTESLAELLKDENLALLETGPGQSLVTLARQHEERGDQAIVAALPDRREGISELAYLLHGVARLWTAGLDLDLGLEGARFFGEGRRRVSLPTYPFERRRHWVEPGAGIGGAVGSPESQAAAGTSGIASAVVKSSIDDALYLPSWRRTVPAAVDDAPTGPWLVFADGIGFGSGLAERLRRAGETVTVVRAGDAFAAPEGDGGAWTVDPGSPADFTLLVSELQKDVGLPRRIVHLFSVTPEDHWTVATLGERRASLLDRSFYSLLFLAQAFGQQPLPDPVEILIVSNGLQEVTGDESLCPLKAALLGPNEVISQEYPQLRCRSIDVDLGGGRSAGDLLADLAQELRGASRDGVVAYRGRHRWVRHLEPLALPAPPADHLPARLRQDGVYLLTGLDATALTYAEHLADRVGARLALLGEEPATADLRQRLERLRQTAEVEILAASLDDVASIGTALDAVTSRFGALHGIFHTAGLPGGGVIQLKTRETASPVLAPKIDGTLALLTALGDRSLDLLVFFSSSHAWTGGVGQVEVASANSVLDALARHRTASGAFTVSIGWDAFRWESVGEAVSAELRRQLEANLEAYGLEAEEGTALLERVLGMSGVPHVLASARDFPAVVAQYESYKSRDALAELEATKPASHGRPELSVSYRGPETETERAIVHLWEDAFGIDGVGIDDNFFELEGNSLSALQIVTRLRQALEVDLPLTALFEAPTVAELSERVEARRREVAELLEVEAMLAEIENLAPEEAEAMLAAERESA